MSELNAGRHALDAIKALPPEEAVVHMATALENVLALAEDWHGEYGGRNFSDDKEFAYTDGRDDAALELELKLVSAAAVAGLLVSVGS